MELESVTAVIPDVGKTFKIQCFRIQYVMKKQPEKFLTMRIGSPPVNESNEIREPGY